MLSANELLDIEDFIEDSYSQTTMSLILKNHHLQKRHLIYLLRKLSTKLQVLYLERCNINVNFLKEIVSLHTLSLSEINLSKNQIGVLGIKMLIKADLPSLQWLIIRICSIGNSGVKHLTKGKWQNLNKLSIWGNNINLDGYSSLQEGNWKMLKNISVANQNPFSTVSLVQIRSNCSITVERYIKNQELKKQINRIMSNKFPKQPLEYEQETIQL